MSESRLILTHVLFDYRQRNYTYSLLSFPNSIPTKDILLIILRIGDENAQPEDQPDHDFSLARDQYIRTYGQRFARQVLVNSVNLKS